MLSDVELVRAARGGDVGALGLLLTRHEAGMRAVALSILGYGPDADDAVQDASLAALRRIGDLREPGSVGPWLRMIVRNACRLRLRSARTVVPVADPMPPADPLSPDRVLDSHASRDWIWHAVNELSPTLRQAVLLRYFTDVNSYEQIAEVLEVPVGTVRSRLNQARGKLAELLRATADQAHADAGAANAASAREAVETLAVAERGDFPTLVADRWLPESEFIAGNGTVRGGRDLAMYGMDKDLTEGVRQRFVHAVAGRDVTIWTMDLISPPDDPEHCPPGVVWVMTRREGRIARLRLFHPV
ncbi:RNA polymerase sigma factor [Kutzneria kofuensis]|uniref:RNA polymerase sigma-70 factor (ECF subfamily) n=1 Tax=Kutzneria kofuensis TaxID=103725 RepID=A0A7W9NEP5_9PSEU|nr:sigma-70 family RNA polymerase sigma factor [Kutzneria kofuensis]MBB5889163.1 RNA polymerase sigma-70 factor (ECF subfamily) [Kutzneria kofuensis]